MEYIHEDERIYACDADGKTLAEVCFPASGADAVTITRTFTDDSLRGQGVASELIRMVCDAAERRNKTVEIACSYAAGWFEKHPEKRGILKK